MGYKARNKRLVIDKITVIWYNFYMKSKYPIVLVHGIMMKDIAFFRAFGRIERILKNNGYNVFTARTDGFGAIENNAVQLKAYIWKILIKYKVEKVNIIAHSKGGLDARHMIDVLGMEGKVASLTTLCTPHRGAEIASRIYKLPKPIKNFIAFWLNLVYKIFGDEHPDALRVCRELSTKAPDELYLKIPDSVYCQSFSASMERSRDDFLMSIPHMFSKKFEGGPTDGLVSVSSAQFGNYRGNAVEGSVSHNEIIDFMAKKKKREKIHEFYLKLCNELSELGF